MKPITRLENFLAKIAGDENAKDLTPITRKEYYLNEIAENQGGGGGGTSGGLFVVAITKDANDVYSADKTYDEIVAAFQGGSFVVATYYTDVYWLNGIVTASNYVTFASMIVQSSSEATASQFSIPKTGAITYKRKSV